jgi:hypothetical protein
VAVKSRARIQKKNPSKKFQVKKVQFLSDVWRMFWVFTREYTKYTAGYTFCFVVVAVGMQKTVLKRQGSIAKVLCK